MATLAAVTKMSKKVAEEEHLALNTLPRVKYHLSKPGAAVRHIKSVPPAEHIWNPLKCDIIAHLTKIINFFNTDTYNIGSMHEYLKETLPFCNSHFDCMLRQGLYSKQLEELSSQHVIVQIALFEFRIVEAVYRYFPRRWTTHGCTLLQVPNFENMTMPELQISFKERFRIVGQVPSQTGDRVLLENALLGNLSGKWKERAQSLFDSMTVLETLEQCVKEWAEENKDKKLPSNL